MANNEQNEFPLLVGLEDQSKRQTARHLPTFFRTDKNSKFLGGTLDPLTQPGKLNRINAYVGRKDIPNYQFDDNYIEENSTPRQYYQLEPSFSFQDPIKKEVKWYADYLDYINSLRYFGAPVANHSRLNKQEAYTWDPHIDWDKFVNYREYYWLPNGPDAITIYGELESVTSTYTVKTQQQGDNSTYVFSPNIFPEGLTSNPRLTLYRGLKYTFIIDCPNKFFSIKNKAEGGDGYFYNIGVSQQKITQGILTFQVPFEAPDMLYYIDNNDINTVGMFDIRDISEALVLDVEKEILGKKNFKSSSGIDLINGLKLSFSGNVTPSKYANSFWYVEGVGTKIKLINYEELATPAIYGSDTDLPFDNEPFDSLPWDTASNYPATKDYIVINRASKDRNTWARSNRWFSRSVIETTATANRQIALIDQSARASRPIIEFQPDIKLYQYGWKYKKNVDLIDTVTTDVFSTIEGSAGYNIDGANAILPGYRILFTADTDPLVNGKIFVANQITNSNVGGVQLTLQETDDTNPIDGEVVYVSNGDSNGGSSYYYQNGKWNKAQTKISINQAPLFDLFDEDMNSFSDDTAYTHNSFSGNRIFGYKIGTGTNDTELGFPLSYLNIDNVGDIEFEFDLETKDWTYQAPNTTTLVDTLKTLNSYSGFLRRHNDDDTFVYVNGWMRTARETDQSVIRVLKISAATDLISIDVYDNSASLNDLRIRVYVNDRKVEASNLSLETIGDTAYIRFASPLQADDKVVYKVRSTVDKNLKGYYEIPLNWQNNPLNESVSTFTFGEATDHLRTIIEDVPGFSGTFPGSSNLANLGTLTPYGKRFLQHSGSMPIASFLMTDENANIIRAMRWSATKYSEFKKEFLRLAQTTAYEGTISEIVDQILLDYSKARYVDTSPFHFSDMAPYGAASVREYTVKDPRLPVFVIDSIFDPMTQTKRSVLVYYISANDTQRKDIQLIYGKDYNFDPTDAFVNIDLALQIGDTIIIKDYASTDGCYIPSTPSKLGIYPSFIPEKYIDDTYVDLIPVIQGHDGSIIKAYNDFRDDLILDLEMRIFNTRRVEYDLSIFNLDSVIGSFYVRNDYTRTEVNDIMLVDFLNWNSIIDQDFTSNEYYIEENSFTYNYSRATAPNSIDQLSGYWRSIYKYFYDTDRPHTHPWEMQGFKIKPSWWDSVYGPAPYTSDNKILWDSIESGIIREPNKRRTIVRYKRPGIKNYLPVDSAGNLLSPLESNLATNFSLTHAKGTYIFGDQAPVETAWRRSSEYPYALMVAMCVLRGSEFIGKMWDRFTIKRNIANQIYYAPTGKRLRPSDLIFSDVALGNPNDPNVARTQTSGLANIIEEYVFMQKYVNIDIYKTYLKGLDAKLSYKIGGFTSKEKIKVLLDSRSPNSSGNIFLPTENYQIFYNKSFPVNTITYSGVLIERLGSTYPGWVSNKLYKKGDRAVYQQDIYRCNSDHTSSTIPYNSTKPGDASTQQFEQDADKWIKEISNVAGFKIKGYDNSKNYFELYPPRISNSDPTFNVGGISESYVEWTANTSGAIPVVAGDPTIGSASTKYYAKGQIAKVGDLFYRAIVGHTSSTSFANDKTKWQQLAKLPIVGGRTASRRTRFEDTMLKIPYGTIFTDIQTVVDFLFGYQHRLQELGFEFDDFSKDLSVPLDWMTSAKEFLFWTLQNWSPGSVITLSPSANLLKFKSTISASVDGFVSDFHDYSIFKADGTPLTANLTDVYRQDNGFTIKPSKDTADGIFHIRTNLVYREHVLLLDNRSIFNDVIYDVVPGYRQGRVKVVGFKTGNWDGGFTSPGFVYDEAKINDWKPNTDYSIGDVVRYKNYYFTAGSRITANNDFAYEDWIQLSKEPTPGLIPNFDYKVEQFRDFYSLDASIYDSNQQALARHLIGYQPRTYLDNIIVDDVSQYKFYQGFIKEKGTYNSIAKLFDALRASGFSTVDIKEEWAFKLGDYGAVDGISEIEFPLDEHAFRYNPQSIVFTTNPQEFTDLSIYNVTSRMLTIKPNSYNSTPFQTTKIDHLQNNFGVFKYRVAGYVKDDDVDHILFNEAALMNYDINYFRENDKIWLGFTSNNDWDVLNYINLRTTITNWSIQGNIVSLECSKIPDVAKDDIITLTNLDELNGTYKVQKVYNNIIDVFTFNTVLYHLQDDSTHGLLYKMESVRHANLSDVSGKHYNRHDIKGEKIWVDNNASGQWLVLENKDVFTKATLPHPTKVLATINQKYGSNIKISGNQKWMFVSEASKGSGKVIVYNRQSIADDWKFSQTLIMPDFAIDIDNQSTQEARAGYLYTTTGSEQFGASVDVSDDGLIVAIGVPGASDLKGYYKGIFSTSAPYVPGDVVQYNGKLWKNVLAVNGDGSTISVNSYHWKETINEGDILGSRSSIIIDSIARDSSNTAFVVTDTPHELTDGMYVSITGIDTFNGATTTFDATNVKITYISESVFSYTNVGYAYSTRLTPNGKVIPSMTKQGCVALFRYSNAFRSYQIERIIGSTDPVVNENFGSKVRIKSNDVSTWLVVGSKNYNNDRGRVQIFKNDLQTISVLETTSEGNFITVSSIENLYVDMPVTFTGIEIGNLHTDKIYYIRSLRDNLITVSESVHGPVRVLTKAKNSSATLTTMLAGGWTNSSQTYLDLTSPITLNPPNWTSSSSQYGYDLDMSDDLSRIVVSAPFMDETDVGTGVGAVYVFLRQTGSNSWRYKEVINRASLVAKSTATPTLNLVGADSYLSSSDGFGYAVLVTNNTMLISCPNDDMGNNNVGSVYYFDLIDNLYRLRSIILPPTTLQNERFGLKLALNSATDVLAIASGGSNYVGITFDVHRDRLSFNDSTRSYALDTTSKLSKNATTYDADSTAFYDITSYTGAVYVYNKFDDDYIYGDKLIPDDSLMTEDDFGASIAITSNTIAVGAPNREINSIPYGMVYLFNFTGPSWTIIESQDSVVDVNKFKKAFIYNTEQNILINELEFYDPAKGLIPRAAEQEIKYQSYHDPAVYQYGISSSGMNVDQSNPWTDEHVGELWWNLSNFKYTWYEQGDSTYRNNNWGRLFVGSTIDVYEWVESSYLPSRWAVLADTEKGLTMGISGIPREIDDFTYSSKFKFDPVNGTKTTLYYYWVKNKTTIPNVSTRKMSSADVSKLLYDPKSQNKSFISVTDANSMSITNVNNRLIHKDISINMEFYNIDNKDLAIHRQYAIIAADDANAIIPHVIEQKWFDSLIGHNTMGYRVPDPNLSQKQRYGALNSPRQSWFVNRYEALKQLFEYVNSVLAKRQIVDEYNLSNLKQFEAAPSLLSGDIDRQIDILDELRFINIDRIETAQLSARVSGGGIVNVSVEEKGFGYGTNKVHYNDAGNAINWYGPNVEILGTGEDAVIQTYVDKDGRLLLDADIKRKGTNYDDDTLILKVRPFTVLVLSDAEAANGWSLQQWDTNKKQWYRVKTQAYNVARYWSYIDWYEEGFSVSSDINHLIDSTYQLGQLAADIGQVIKVNNDGSGNWLLLERIAETNGPDYTVDYKVVGRENATIKFSDGIYNLGKDSGFDTNYGFSTNLYDQNPTTELRIILQALRDDILVDDLRIEYVKTFFNNIHYVLSEQLYADWMFKTSFLKVNHNVGTLKQRITFQSDVLDSYQTFIEEAKPYKTKIREWVSSYNSLEQSGSVITDFDLPSYYDPLTGSIETVNSNSISLKTYPWKNWLDNHTYSLVDVVISDPGKNYITAPKVIISGGFVDSNKKITETVMTTTDMSSSATYVQLKRTSGVSTDSPMTAAVPGVYATWTFSQGNIILLSSGLPYHGFGNTDAVNQAKAQNIKVTIPLRAGTDDPASVPYAVGLGTIGYWLNGVAVFNPSAGSGAPTGFALPPIGFNYNAAYESGLEIGYNFGEDLAGGHAQENGIYHYHDFSFATAWMTGSGAVSGSNTYSGISELSIIPYLADSSDHPLTHPDGHSKILGWAIDGYPIYGPYGYTDSKSSTSKIRIMQSGYRLKDYSYRQGTNASNLYTFPMGIFVQDYEFADVGDLDTHNGRFCITPDYPNGTYAYFTTVSPEGTPVFPYVIGTTYYGVPLQKGLNIEAGTGIAPVAIPTTTAANVAASETEINATATAYLADGKLYKIIIDNPGIGYITAPTVYISGGTSDVENDGAKAYAVIGNSKARSVSVGIKFDRYTFSYEAVDVDGYTTFTRTDTFTGDGNTSAFKLKYAPEIEKSKINISINDIEIFGAQYTVTLDNVLHDTYTALEGTITFTESPALNSNIVITYNKNISLYAAADRVNYAYNASPGQYGKDLGQLMTGIDYGGVSLTSIGFDVSGGWDVLPWDATSWDNVLDTNNDVVITSDGTTTSFDLGYIPADGEVINIYIERQEPPILTKIIRDLAVNDLVITVKSLKGIKVGDLITIAGITYFGKVMSIYSNNSSENILITDPIPQAVSLDSDITFTRSTIIRIDDPYYSLYDGSTEQPNGRKTKPDNAQMDSFVGDGITSIVYIPETVSLTGDSTPNNIYDTLIFRKSTSDGSLLPTDRSLLDSFVTGGDLTYQTARGIAADEIVIDGDGLVTADTSHGPEELIQGQVVDTLDINVYHAPSTGGPNIVTQIYTGDGTTTTFDLDQLPGTTDGLTVLIDDNFVDFTINFKEKTVTLSTVPDIAAKVAIISIDTAGYDILDKAEFVGDGSTKEFLTAARFLNGNVTLFATVDGVVATVNAKASDKKYEAIGNVLVVFDAAPNNNSVIQIMVFSAKLNVVEQKFSEVKNQYIDVIPGTRTYTLTNPPGTEGPITASTFVVAFSYSTTAIYRVSRYSNIVTITTTATHGLKEGDIVDIKDVAGFNKIGAIIISVPTSTTFTYSDAGNDISDPVRIADFVTDTTYVIANLGSGVNWTNIGVVGVPSVGTSFVYNGREIFGIGGTAHRNLSSGYVIAERKTGEFLRGPDYQNFVYDGVSSIAISEIKYSLNTLIRADINVYRNGTILISGRDYDLDPARNQITLRTGKVGDNIIVEIIKNNDYIIEGNQITFNSKYNLDKNKQVKITTFTNHNILKVKRTSKTFRFTAAYDILTYDAVKYDTFGTSINSDGVIDLPRTISNTSGIFVAFNRKLLTLDQDFTVLANRNQIKVILPDVLTNNDYLEVITTNDETVSPSYGFKIFKDMINRTHYKVIDKKKTTKLAKTLNYYDTKIEVVDGSVLEDLGSSYLNGTRSNIPGVVEIEGERIEYFIKEGNILRQLRRATLGTSMNTKVVAGTKVIEFGQKNTIPYSDKENKITYFGNGVVNANGVIIGKRVFDLDFVPDASYGTINDGSSYYADWYRDTIPDTHGQCDSIEVFVAGRRLRKNPIQVYDPSLGQDSYNDANHVWLEAEFSVDGIDNSVRLTNIPLAGEMVIIVYKNGKLWQKYNEGVSLRFSDTDIARFVTARTADLPK